MMRHSQWMGDSSTVGAGTRRASLQTGEFELVGYPAGVHVHGVERLDHGGNRDVQHELVVEFQEFPRLRLEARAHPDLGRVAVHDERP